MGFVGYCFLLTKLIRDQLNRNKFHCGKCPFPEFKEQNLCLSIFDCVKCPLSQQVSSLDLLRKFFLSIWLIICMTNLLNQEDNTF